LRGGRRRKGKEKGKRQVSAFHGVVPE
jgi:hypothetical protein